MESDDFTRHYIIRYLSACELVLPPLAGSCLFYSPIGGLPSLKVVPHSPIGSPQDIPRTPILGSCPSVLSVPQSHWGSPGHPKDSHPWECPVCPTVPLGVPWTSQGLPPLGVVPAGSCLFYSPIGGPRDIPRIPTLGSCPSWVLSVLQSHWGALGHSKDSHPWELSHSPIGSPQDIPRTPTLGSCPSVPSGVPGTSQGIPPLGMSCLSHSPIGGPRDIPRNPTLGNVLSVPQSHWESPGHPKDSHPWELSQCPPVCPTVPLEVPGTSQGLAPLGMTCVYHILLGVSGTPNGPMS